MGFWCLVVARLPTDNQLCVQRMRGLIITYGMMTIAMWHKHCYNDYGNWTITALFCLFATAYYKTHCVEFLLAVCLFPKQNIFRGHLEVHKCKRKLFTHTHARSHTGTQCQIGERWIKDRQWCVWKNLRRIRVWLSYPPWTDLTRIEGACVCVFSI